MVQRKPALKPASKRVWRVTEAAPLGEFVDPDARPASPATDDPAAVGWLVSSFELLNGTDISEGPDTVPADLFDELFPTAVARPKPRGDK